MFCRENTLSQKLSTSQTLMQPSFTGVASRGLDILHRLETFNRLYKQKALNKYFAKAGNY